MKFQRLAPLAVAAGLLLAPARADAASGATVQSGWWNEAAVGPVTAPSATPTGQLQVSNGFSGPLAFAAVRIALPAGTDPASSITLSLDIPSNSTVGTPAVSACPTTSSWKPGPDQPASAAPGYSCRAGRQADGQPGTGAERWTFPAAWGAGGSVSVALVPTPGTTQPFSVTYTAPTTESVSVGPVDGGGAQGAGASPPAPAPVASDGGTAAASPTGSGQPVSGGVDTGGSPAAGAAAVAAPDTPTGAGGAGPAPALGSIPGGGSGGGPGSGGTGGGTGAVGGTGGTGAAGGAVAAPASVAPGGGTHPSGGGGLGRSGRVMAFCLLVGTGLALWFVSAQPDRAPRLLGSLGSGRLRPAGGGGVPARTPAPAGGAVRPVVRGLGRFARERTSPPNRL